MIRAETGEFKLDEYSLIIHPKLTASQFRAGLLAAKEINVPRPWARFEFTGRMDGLRARFNIFFSGENIEILRWSQDERQDAQDGPGSRALMDADDLAGWLAAVIKKPPPYEYDWGEIFA